jgi:isopentenyl phosphate kinase
MSSEAQAVYIKAGGSFLTFKDKPFSINFHALEALSKILKSVLERKRVILANGGGSFAHTIVTKLMGRVGIRVMVVECQRTTRWLNKLIVDYLVDEGVEAASIQTSAIIGGKGGKYYMNLEPVISALRLGITPVVYGECIFTDGGFEVLSTEKVFKLMAQHLKPEMFVFLMDVDGVFTCNPHVCEKPTLIEKIDSNNYSSVIEMLKGSERTDATGGVYGKVKSAVELSREFQVPVVLTSGFDVDNVSKILNKGLTGVKATVVDLRGG